MSGHVRFLVLAAFGVMLVRVALSDLLYDYVGASSRPYVLVAGAVLATMGTVLWLVPVGSAPAAPASGWLVLAPIVALMLVPPPSEGALVGHHRHGAPPRGAAIVSELHGPDPVSLSVAAFVQRAVWAPRSLRGHVVRLVGFVADTRARTVVLARLSITCCAADAQQDDVDVRVGVGFAPDYARGEWLSVLGRYAGPSATDRFVPMLAAAEVASVATPPDPYD